MVTIEFAVGITLAMVVTVVLTGISLLGVAQAACAESSAQLARQAARGDEAQVRAAADRAPSGSSIEWDWGLDGVGVVVSVDRELPLVGVVTLSAGAWAAYEPGISRP